MIRNGAHTQTASRNWSEVHMRSEACDTTALAIRDKISQGLDNALVKAVKGFFVKQLALSWSLLDVTSPKLAPIQSPRERFVLDAGGAALASGGLEKKKHTTVLDRGRRRECSDESASPRTPLSVRSTVIHGTRQAAVSNERFLEDMRDDNREGRARMCPSIDCKSEWHTQTHDSIVSLGEGKEEDIPLIRTII